MGFWSWAGDKVKDTAGAVTNIAVGLTQPIVENTIQAGTGVAGMAGGLTATAVGYGGQGVGIAFEEAGFEFGETMKDKSAGLTAYGHATTVEGAHQIGEAVEDTFTPGGEVVGGVYHAGTNAESIVFDWSDEDNEGDDGKGWAYRDWEWQRVDWDEERKSNIDMMKQDDHGWTGDSLIDAIWGGTLGSAADSWTDIVAEGTLAADDEMTLRGYETMFQDDLG